jgi:glycosyltransferase involved in cell wall biosynthesis
MKILFAVEFYEPHKGGAEEVVRQLAERLALRGHQVTVVTSYLPNRDFQKLNGVVIEPFKISGNQVRGITGGLGEIRRFQDFIASGFDAVIVYAAQVWTADLVFPILDKISGKKIFIPCGYSGLMDPAFAEYFKKLPEYLCKFDKLVYMSPNYQDKVFGDKNGAGGKAVIISNGAATEEFLKSDDYHVREKLNIKTKYLLITVANHYRDKGHGFVIEAFKKMNRQDATLLVIGENPGKDFWHKIKQLVRGCYKNCLANSLTQNNIKLIGGKNRELVLSAYKSADLFLFGSKVECAPLVLYESFASKTVFVSTPVGNVPDYQDYVKIVRSPEEMANSVNWLLDHESERLEMVNRSFILWQENHTWDKIADEYNNLLTNLKIEK